MMTPQMPFGWLVNIPGVISLNSSKKVLKQPKEPLKSNIIGYYGALELIYNYKGKKLRTGLVCDVMTYGAVFC